MNIDGVTPAKLRRELRKLGYREFEASGRAGVTWVDSNDLSAPTVVVPREEDQKLRGYSDTIVSAVERLSWITEEPASVVLQRLVGTIDRLELRIVHELTQDHGVPVLKAISVMEGFVALIKNGARTEFSGARADHRGSAGPKYAAALDAIEVLAPAAGSFRLIAVTADPHQVQMTSEPGAEPRGVLATTLRTLEALSNESRPASSLANDDVERLVDNGVSRQLLRAVTKLSIAGTSGLRLEFTGSWDPDLPDLHAPQKSVVIGDAQLALARGLNEKLGALEPTPGFFLSGWAETARAQNRSLEGFPSGTIVVRSRHQGRLRDVLVDLGAEIFPTVKPGVSELQMVGTLERISGRWHLLEPRQIVVSTPKSPVQSRQIPLDHESQ